MFHLLYFVTIFLSTCLLIIIGFVNVKVKRRYVSDTKVSVIVIKNDENKETLPYTIPILNNYRNVDEIIVLYGTEQEHYTLENSKLLNRNNFKNFEKYKSFHRYGYFHNVKNECILLLDSDIIPTQRLLLKLLENYDNDIENIYGPFSKLCDVSGYYSVSFQKNMLHSPILLSSKKVFLKVWYEMTENQETMKQLQSCNYENEDIVFNKTFRNHYRKLPIAVHGKYKRFSNKFVFRKRKYNKYCKEIDFSLKK